MTLRRIPSLVSVFVALCSCLLIARCVPGTSTEQPAAETTAKTERTKEPGPERTPEEDLEPSPEPAPSEEPATEPVAEDAGAPDTPTPPEGTFPLQPKTWLVGALQNGQADTVGAALEQGNFVYPQGGAYPEFGWSVQNADPEGKIFAPRVSVAYAITQITVPYDVWVIVQAQSAFTVYLNGARQPGDYYSTGRYQAPMRLKRGTNDLVVRLLSRNTPNVRLWTTTDTIALNTKDLTAPLIPLGDTSEQCVGFQVLNLSEQPIDQVTAKVIGSDDFEETTLTLPALPAGGTTQVPFLLKPKRAPTQPDIDITVKVEVSSPSLNKTYTADVTVKTVAKDKAYRVTHRSKIDGSCQFYGVQPASNPDPQRAYGLILSLHGAGANGLGQARAYSQKDWAMVIAPNNRRPFGFDWEAWGRLDGLEALEHAKQRYRIDPTKVYVTGHSMGGHGTWQFGVLFPGRFATASPSAGWSSFYSYTGRRRPTGPFAVSQASSDTNKYLENLKKRGVYIIHGGADTNVPVREGRDMYAAVQQVTQDVQYHEEPGKGHWWDVDKDRPGADCVDWKPMIDFLQQRTLDPFELDFTFKTPGLWVSPKHSYVTLQATQDPYAETSITSQHNAQTVTLTTKNVQSAILDGKALQDKGIQTVIVDGTSTPVDGKDITIGPQDGKTHQRQGPFEQAMHQPFCLIYPDQGDTAYQRYAGFLSSVWSFLGNGHTCAMPLSRVDASLKASHNMIYLGIPSSKLTGIPQGIAWDQDKIQLAGDTFTDAAIAVVFPEGDRLSAAMFATQRHAFLLFRIQPFSSGFSLPDYFVWRPAGGVTGGFFDHKWSYDASFRR